MKHAKKKNIVNISNSISIYIIVAILLGIIYIQYNLIRTLKRIIH